MVPVRLTWASILCASVASDASSSMHELAYRRSLQNDSFVTNLNEDTAFSANETESLSPFSPSPTAVAAEPLPNSTAPSLAPTVGEVQPNFRARYVGRFQAKRDTGCTFPTPAVVRASCPKGSTLQLEGTSDPSIVCKDDIVGGHAIVCTSACESESNSTSSACETVYLNIDKDFDAGSFGEVYFACEGNKVEDVEGTFTFEGGAGAVCTGGFDEALNFHIARLGVACPGLANDMVRPYLFDDYYTDCVWPARSFRTNEAPNDGYTCFSGRNCGDWSCDFSLKDLAIVADFPNFYECVENNNNLPIEYTREPPWTNPARLFTTKFHAAWGLLFDEAVSNDLSCSSQPFVSISCTNDGTVELVETVFESTTCTGSGSETLTCTDSKGTFIDRFSGVSYTCTSPAVLPETRVEWDYTDLRCGGDEATSSAYSRASLQMGASCFNRPDGWFTDYFFDCGDPSNVYEYLYDDGTFAFKPGGEEIRFTCSDVATSGNQSSVISMSTDFQWDFDNTYGCFEESDREIVPAANDSPSGSLLDKSPTRPARSSSNDSGDAPTSPAALANGPSGSNGGVSSVLIVVGIAVGVAFLGLLGLAFVVGARSANKPSLSLDTRGAHSYESGIETDSQSGGMPVSVFAESVARTGSGGRRLSYKDQTRSAPGDVPDSGSALIPAAVLPFAEVVTVPLEEIGAVLEVVPVEEDDSLVQGEVVLFELNPGVPVLTGAA